MKRIINEVVKSLKNNNQVEFVVNYYNHNTILPHIEVRGVQSLTALKLPADMKLEGTHIIYKKEGIEHRFHMIIYP